MDVSVDLVPQSGAQIPGSLNNRVFDIERVRYFLSIFFTGKLDEMYLAVEFTSPVGLAWYQERLKSNKGNLQALLTILMDATGNLNPRTEARQSAFDTIATLIDTRGDLTKERLVASGLVDESPDHIAQGVRLQAITGNHSSMSGRLWKRDVVFEADLNPTLDPEIKYGTSMFDLEERRDVTRHAQVFIWCSFNHTKAEEINLGAMLKSVAAADNRLETNFVAGVQNYRSILLAMRSSLTNAYDYIICQLRSAQSAEAAIRLIAPSNPLLPFLT
jgi:hypothetical protein